MFKVVSSKARILRRLWKILRRRVCVCLPLLETLPQTTSRKQFEDWVNIEIASPLGWFLFVYWPKSGRLGEFRVGNSFLCHNLSLY